MKLFAYLFGMALMTASGFFLVNGHARTAVMSAIFGLLFLTFWVGLHFVETSAKVDNILQEECRATCLSGCIHGECIREGKRQ